MNKAALTTRKGKLRLWSSWCISYVMVLPAMVFLVLFVLYPAADMIYLSLFQGNATRPTKEFVGLSNYNRLFFVKDDFLSRSATPRSTRWACW
jgi:ABC-type sugar transport system permease subunit